MGGRRHLGPMKATAEATTAHSGGYFAADIKFPGVVELTTQLLILENILWLLSVSKPVDLG